MHAWQDMQDRAGQRHPLPGIDRQARRRAERRRYVRTRGAVRAVAWIAAGAIAWQAAGIVADGAVAGIGGASAHGAPARQDGAR